MSVFEGEVLRQTVAVAVANKIEPAALLSVVEVESAGKSLEQDGRTPRLLFERHVFYRELKKAKATADLSRAQLEGLAHSDWRRETQYKDQGTSAKRLALFQRARTINEECAIRSCSWGVGQTMGFLAEELKFGDAKKMFAYMVTGGVPAQVECMVREIKRKGIDKHLNNHAWAAFAKVYNGPKFAENKYDTKMASAYEKWKVMHLPTSTPPAPVVVADDVAPSEPITKPIAEKPAVVTAGVAVGAGTTTASVWAYFKQMTPEMVLFIVGIFVLIAITFVVLRKRKAIPKTQTGVLPQIDVGAKTPTELGAVPKGV